MTSNLFGNGSDIVHWQPSCNARGTYDILSTCLITMLLCVWTAVHLNVPPPGSTRFFMKFGWLILALLAPELVAFTAWYQRQEARSVMHKVNKAFKLPNPSSWSHRFAKGISKAIAKLKRAIQLPTQATTRQPTLESQKDASKNNLHPWTMTHGFYAIMGGLAIQIPENLPASKRFLPSDISETWFLTSGSVEYLLGQGSTREELPDLSKEEIRSKSKANGLAKALVCTQALWFITQCITRLAQHIPISLLELNTFGHALCAVLIYILWWEKPFEVDYPSIIQSQSLWDYRALVVMTTSSATGSPNREERTSIQDGKQLRTLQELKIERQQLLREFSLSESDLIQVVETFDDGLRDGNSNEILQQDSELVGNKNVASIDLMPGQVLPETGFRIQSLRDIQFEQRIDHPDFGIYHPFETSPDLRKAFDEPTSNLPHVHLIDRDVIRWRMAWRAYQSHVRLGRGKMFSMSQEQNRVLVQRSGNWPEFSSIFQLPIVIGFTTATFIYGGLHALAWSAHFDSATEKMLWRISSCFVVGGLPVMIGLLRFFDYLQDNYDGYMYRVAAWSSAILILLMLIAYVLARAYLVVECFINVFNLPAGVYDTPTWSVYFPHIS